MIVYAQRKLKPVLAMPLPGMKAIIPNEDYGVIYSDIDEFAENTVKLLRDDEKMSAVGERELVYAKKNHDWNEIAHKHINRRNVNQLNK